MSEISNLLRDQSEHLTEQLQKQAEAREALELTKEAAVSALIEEGVSEEEASELVKSAEELSELQPAAIVVDPQFVSTVFIKAAQYIEQLEADAAEMQVKIKHSEDLVKEASYSSPATQDLQVVGFSKEQVNILAEANMLDKVASLMSTPWEPGASSGQLSQNAMDPIEAFCFGRSN